MSAQKVRKMYYDGRKEVVTMIHYRLGQTVLSYRKKNNMTIREFADYAGISTSLISQIERGHANPSLNVLELIAKALNVPLFTLLLMILIQTHLFLRRKIEKKYIEKIMIILFMMY